MNTKTKKALNIAATIMYLIAAILLLNHFLGR